MKYRNWQDSNLRSQRESDFESDAITTRPQLLPRLKVLGVLNRITLKIMGISMYADNQPVYHS